MRIFLLAAALFVIGCATTINTSAVSGTMTRVIDGHDAYVHADAALATSDKQTDLSQSAFLRTELSNATITPAAISANVNAVTTRYEAYLNADQSLTSAARVNDTRDAELLRELVQLTPATRPAN